MLIKPFQFRARTTPLTLCCVDEEGDLSPDIGGGGEDEVRDDIEEEVEASPEDAEGVKEQEGEEESAEQSQEEQRQERLGRLQANMARMDRENTQLRRQLRQLEQSGQAPDPRQDMDGFLRHYGLSPEAVGMHYASQYGFREEEEDPTQIPEDAPPYVRAMAQQVQTLQQQLEQEREHKQTEAQRAQQEQWRQEALTEIGEFTQSNAEDYELCAVEPDAGDLILATFQQFVQKTGDRWGLHTPDGRAAALSEVCAVVEDHYAKEYEARLGRVGKTKRFGSRFSAPATGDERPKKKPQNGGVPAQGNTDVTTRGGGGDTFLDVDPDTLTPQERLKRSAAIAMRRREEYLAQHEK